MSKKNVKALTPETKAIANNIVVGHTQFVAEQAKRRFVLATSDANLAAQRLVEARQELALAAREAAETAAREAAEASYAAETAAKDAGEALAQHLLLLAESPFGE